MSTQRYAAMACKHWQTWLPKWVAQLKADGELEQAVQTAGKLASEEVLSLMQQGFRQHEAEEMALAQFILLKPEAGANMEPWEREEEAKLQAQYRKMMGE